MMLLFAYNSLISRILCQQAVFSLGHSKIPHLHTNSQYVLAISVPLLYTHYRFILCSFLPLEVSPSVLQIYQVGLYIVRLLIISSVIHWKCLL